jgi:initiation factor 1A
MVKNVKGGSSHKKEASKFAKPNDNKVALKLRVSEDPYEVYAQITALLGNSMCHVICQDGKTRLCIIRGKFRGKRKRDNTLTKGKWVLIGLRDYEIEKKDKLETCDLLDIYSDQDKDRLQSKVVDVNWTPFLNNDSINSQMPLILDGPRFIDEREEEYNRLMEINSVLPSTTTITAPIVQPPSYDEVDFADI